VEERKEQLPGSRPSPAAERILERAKQLNSQGKRWHHHMLFPICRYNRHSGKWVIVFEDRKANGIIESLSDDEPKGDLRYIETLFYQQKQAG
jgi:hypothetical protein